MAEKRVICSACGREYCLDDDGAWGFMPSAIEMQHHSKWDDKLQLFARWRRERSAVNTTVANSPTVVGETILEKFAKFTRIDSGVILDIGCAAGEISRHFVCDEYWGVDPMPLAHGNERILRGIGESLPFNGETFDHIILSQVLDHCADPQRLFAEVVRVARPRAKVHALQYVIDGDRRRLGYLLVRLKRALGIQVKVHSWETKPRLLAMDEVRRLVDSSGSFECCRWEDKLIGSQILLTACIR
jgi:SAM-dependent methyltransferase